MIYKPKTITGFPEWLPQERLIELKWIDAIRKVFESYGFCSIETPAVEEVKVLISKGETDKEIYKISRLQGDDDNTESRLALHYDLTVPLARYVVQHFGQLVFPFKRYQIQKVWRGERPQAGRFREFYQCDIDIVNIDNLPIFFDAELTAIIYEILIKLNVGKFEICISNRKILEGFLNGLNVYETAPIIRIIDKLDKIAENGIKYELKNIGVSDEVIEKCIKISSIRTKDTSFIKRVNELGVTNSLLSEGLEELEYILKYLNYLPEGVIIADLSIARGFDYYTGTIYEAKLIDDRKLGTICSGGRYENLCSSYSNKKLPGVGISIGLSRIISKFLQDNAHKLKQKCPTDILVILPKLEMQEIAYQTAQILRKRGFNVEVYHKATKLQTQLQYANNKGINYVWFPPFDLASKHEIKNLETGQQAIADPNLWKI